MSQLSEVLAYIAEIGDLTSRDIRAVNVVSKTANATVSAACTVVKAGPLELVRFRYGNLYINARTPGCRVDMDHTNTGIITVDGRNGYTIPVVRGMCLFAVMKWGKLFRIPRADSPMKLSDFAADIGAHRVEQPGDRDSVSSELWRAIMKGIEADPTITSLQGAYTCDSKFMAPGALAILKFRLG